MSEGHILFNVFFRCSRSLFLIRHFILFPLFAFPFAGAVDKIVLPDGMQSVNFCDTRITGTAELGYE